MTVLTSVSTPSTGDDAIFALKQQAVTAGWSVPASGDGVATYGAASDVITTSAALGTSGAWFRLKMPGATRELLFTRKATATAWTIKYSVVGFVGGSPSPTVSPTATDSRTLIDGTLLTTDGTYRWVISADNTAPYELWAAGLVVGSLATSGAVALLAMATGSYDSTDVDPYALYAVGGTVFVANTLSYGNTTVGFGTVFAAWLGATWSVVGFALPYISGSYGSTGTFVNAGVVSISGKEVPLEIHCLHVSNGHKGRVRGAKQVSMGTGTAPYGTHLTDGNGAYWLRVGDLWLQWSATVPSL